MNNKSFDDKRIAQGYAKDRPWLHKLVMERLKSDCAVDTPFHNGLDVGCGAGLSSQFPETKKYGVRKTCRKALL